MVKDVDFEFECVTVGHPICTAVSPGQNFFKSTALPTNAISRMRSQRLGGVSRSFGVNTKYTVRDRNRISR